MAARAQSLRSAARSCPAAAAASASERVAEDVAARRSKSRPRAFSQRLRRPPRCAAVASARSANQRSATVPSSSTRAGKFSSFHPR